jgi:PAS domain S-box-containing protein
VKEQKVNVNPLPKKSLGAQAPQRSFTVQRTAQKAWLLALLLLLFILPLMAGTYWMYLESKSEIAQEELQGDLLRARTLSTIVEQDFTSAQNVLTSVADRPELRDEWDRHDVTAMEAHLQEVRALEPAFLFVGVFDLEGNSHAIVPPARILGDNFAFRDWYRGVTAHWQPYVSEVYRTAVPPHPWVVAVAVPVRAANGNPTAILMGTYGLSQLTGKFSTIEEGGKSDYYILDQNGIVAASPNVNAQGDGLRLSSKLEMEHALTGQEGAARLQIDGKNTFAGFAPVPKLGWAVVYSRPESIALASVLHLKNKYRSITLYLLLVYLATAALAALLMRHQTRLLSANQALNAELENRITQSKLAREELDRYFTLSIDMLCIAGTDGYFKRVNPAWQRVLGHTTEELLTTPRLQFVHPDDREATIREIAKLSEGRETVSFENRYICKDGSYKWLSWHAAPFREQQLIYAIARDVTELKQTQQALIIAKDEAERSNKFKDQFLSTMSHELRTPLNAVIGFSDLLIQEQYGQLNDKQKRYVKHINTGGHHLLRLINDILDLSKIEAGRLQLSIENVPVGSTFSYVVDAVRPLADKKAHTIVLKSPSDLSVRADFTRFKQILLNLLGNAIKFTPDGGQIELAAAKTGDTVRIEVRDSGPGIPVDEQHRIFEAFYRLGQNDRAVEGTGLGLAITRRLVELQGGQLGIESEPNTGSCFFFTLPLVPTMQKLESPEKTHGLQSASGTSRILVVEDDPAAAQLLETHLQSAGYEVVLCKEPHKAVDIAAELQPSAVTLDVLMKPMSGWEVLPALKSDPRTAAIPAIVITIVDEQAVGALLGADEYIVKPVNREVLLGALERCLRSRSARPETGSGILLVEDDVATREFLGEMLSNQGYKVETAGDVAEARARVTLSLPELVILDLILPHGSGFQLLSEWRANSRTSDLPIFILTSKDLTSEERNYLRANSSALLRKQELWQETLVKELQRVISPNLVTQS